MKIFSTIAYFSSEFRFFQTKKVQWKPKKMPNVNFQQYFFFLAFLFLYVSCHAVYQPICKARMKTWRSSERWKNTISWMKKSSPKSQNRSNSQYTAHSGPQIIQTHCWTRYIKFHGLILSAPSLSLSLKHTHTHTHTHAHIRHRETKLATFFRWILTGKRIVHVCDGVISQPSGKSIFLSVKKYSITHLLKDCVYSRALSHAHTHTQAEERVCVSEREKREKES